MANPVLDQRSNPLQPRLDRRSGGHLLFADVGPKPYIDTLRGHIVQCRLSIEEEDITPAVSRALRITCEPNRKKIQEDVPVVLRSIFRNCRHAGHTGV